MADQPDPPASPGSPDPQPDPQPDPPEKWRVYEEDKTPDPEPPSEPPPVPYGNTPHVPYGTAGQADYNPVFVTTTSSAAPKIILLVVALVVLGAVAAGAVAIFAAVDGGVAGLGGIDAKDPDDFEEFVDELEEETGTTEVQSVNLYSNYIIVYMRYSDDPSDNRQISYTWRGGSDFEEWTKSTSDEPTFDLRDIDPEVIDGMCDPVLAEAEGATDDDCYVFLSKPDAGSRAWFRAFASDDFGRSVDVDYDKSGNELPEP